MPNPKTPRINSAPKAVKRKRVKKTSREPYDMCHPMDGEPCTYSEWLRAEVKRICDKDD